MDCENLKKHDAHTIKRIGDSSHYDECPGRETSVRFIDRFEKVWVCKTLETVEDKDRCKGPFPKHVGCGIQYVVQLDRVDFRNLCLNLAMTEEEIREII